MELSAKYLRGSQFEIEARGHRLICDQPVESGGSDAGMTPPEFLLASLASCAGYYAAQYLNARDLSVEGLSVKVTADKAQQPARLGKFRIEVTAPPLEERHQQGLIRAVKSCLIHATLLGNPAIEVNLQRDTTMKSEVLVGIIGSSAGNAIGAPADLR